MSAQQIFEAMSRVRPNNGLAIRVVEYFLNNSANLRVIEGMSVDEVASYICTVYLDVAGSCY